MSRLSWEFTPRLVDNVTQVAPTPSPLPFGWVDTEEEDPAVRDLDPETRLNFSELVQTADIVDSEFRSLRESMIDRCASLTSWALLREPKAAAAGAEFLYIVDAYTEKEAWYMIFCHASSRKAARLVDSGTLPADYAVDCLALVEGLLGESRRVADVMPNFVALDTGAYRLVPAAEKLFPRVYRDRVT